MRKVSAGVAFSSFFPISLVTANLKVLTEWSGSDKVVAGGLYSLVALPFFALSYYLSRSDRTSIFWLSFVLPVFGFYPLVYSIKAPYSVILWSLMLLAAFLPLSDSEVVRSTFIEENGPNALVMLIPPSISLISLEKAVLGIVGLFLVVVLVYLLRRNVSVQYVLSYVVTWSLVNLDCGFEALGFLMGLIFGLGIFHLIRRLEVISATLSRWNY